MTTADMVVYEADQYFERNQDAIKTNDASRGTHLVAEFIQKINSSMCHSKIRNFCEIGCNYGYNLFYLSKQLGLNCSGIEPSPKAVNYGIKKSSDFGSQSRGGYAFYKAYPTIFPSIMKNLTQ